ncbi:unannotated protein [freshwater metagenome]|uniref:Unannotated protein n=1 Tax=freshwater metagenome TaxID=449393 RepID=A0A6J6U4T9_9ZZZZ
MGITFLINGLLRGVSHEQPLDLAILREYGISPAMAGHYARTGWLVRMGKGVYCVAGARLDRDQSLVFLQGRIEGLHVGGRTALAWQGVRRYLEAQERLTMWAPVRGDLPEWFTERFPGSLTSLSLFDDATKEAGIVTPPAVTDGVRVSSRERALLELLREVRTALQLQEARELLFATLGLRPAVLGELLTGCTSVKTVRLFLMWATQAGNVDVDALRDRYALPTGSASRWIGTLADGTKLVLPA